MASDVRRANGTPRAVRVNTEDGLLPLWAAPAFFSESERQTQASRELISSSHRLAFAVRAALFEPVNLAHGHSVDYPSMLMATKQKDLAARKAEETATTDVATAPQEAKRMPIRTFREGDCSASLWSREVTLKDGKRVFFSVTLERSYKDRDGQFRYTKTFDPDSLPRVASLTQQVQQAIDELQQAQ